MQIIDKKTSLIDAFGVVDDVLRQGVQGISELITMPGLINVDFADVRAIMDSVGSALMGIGRSSGENRAVDAAKQAIASPLLELSIDGAKGILFTITGGSDLGMHEVAEAAKTITSSADEDAKVIFGANIDESLKEEVRITVVATGFDGRDRHKRLTPGVVEVQAQSTWTPTSILRVREENHDHFGSSSSLSTPKPKPSVPTYAPPKPSPMPSVKPESNPLSEKAEEDELDIPAFIRKKMM